MRGTDIDWNRVFYFSQIALHGSLKEASKHLGLGISTLSEHLSQLERDLNIPLFRREHRKLILTPDGQHLFQQARQMFETGLRLLDVVSPISLGGYPVSVAVVSSPTLTLSFEVLRTYLESFGPTNFKVQRENPDEITRGLFEARYDFALTNFPSDQKRIVSRPLTRAPIGVYINKDLAKMSLENLLKTLPILIPSGTSAQRTLAFKVLEHFQLSPVSTVSSDYLWFLGSLCQRKLGVGFFSQAWADGMDSQLLQVKLPKGVEPMSETGYVLWAKGAENSESIRRLLSILG